jgi:hypothetical protein
MIIVTGVKPDRLEPLVSEPSDFPLQIQLIPESERISPELGYRLIHQETGLQVPGPFAAAEAQLIQKVTQYWDWRVDKNNKLACAARLLQFLEQLCTPPSDNKEGAI